MIGPEMTMASSLRKLMISSAWASSPITNPGTAAPRVMDMLLKSTAIEMIAGTVWGLNHCEANFDGELRMKMFPKAASADPMIQ